MQKKTPYLETEAFKQLLHRYEEMLETGTSAYFEAEEIIDITEYYLLSHREEEASQCLKYALDLHPNSTEVLVFHAREKIYNKKIEEARQIETIIPDKSDSGVKFLHGELFIAESNMDEADKYFKDVFGDDDESYWLDVAALFIDYDDPQRALEWLTSITSSSIVESRKFLQLKAESHMALGDVDLAKPMFEHLLDEDPYDISNWSLMAEAQFIEGSFKESIDSCDFALAIDSKDEQALRVKGNCLFTLDEFEEAHAVYEKLLSVNPLDDVTLLMDSVCLNRLERYQDALECLNRLCSMIEKDSPFYSQIYVQMAYAYSGLKRLQEALNILDNAYTAGLSKVDCLFLKGDSYLENSYLEEAESCFSQAMEDDHENMELYMRILDSYLMNKQYEGLILLCEKLMQNETYRNKCYAPMAYSSFKLGKKVDYIRYLKLAGENDPKGALALFNAEFPNVDPEDYYIFAQRNLLM